jgi:hypothetical protein
MKTIQLQSKPMPEQPTLDIDGTEGARRATGVPSMSGPFVPPDSEVPEKKPRRKYTAAYKLRILKEYDAPAQYQERSEPCYAGKASIIPI